MGRNSSSPDRLSSGEEDGHNAAAAANPTTSQGFRSIRDRIRVKRTPNPVNNTTAAKDRAAKTTSDRRRSHHHGRPRKFFPFRGRSLLYFCVLLAVFAFALASMVLQSSIASAVFHMGVGRSERRGRLVKEGLAFGSALRFVPSLAVGPWRRGSVELDRLRQSGPRIGIRPPRLALVLGNMTNDPASLMLYTVVKSLQELGYLFKIYAVDDGKAHSTWEKIGGQIFILNQDSDHQIDWLMCVMLDFLEHLCLVGNFLSVCSFLT